MTTTTITSHCQAAGPCPQPPCFHAHLEAQSTPAPVRRTADLCAVHLGDVVHDLTAWAHRAGLTSGQVTVSIITAASGQLPVPAAGQPASGGLAFATIPLTR
jgi:hypothetical protein